MKRVGDTIYETADPLALGNGSVTSCNKCDMQKEDLMEVLVKLIWDAQACVWIAQSDDVPGLVLESGSFDALIERVRFAVPELLTLNGLVSSPVQLRMVSERCERIAM